MKYIALNNQIFSKGDYKIVPIRFEDRYDIMKWRNEQIYHLRQDRPLTFEEQENYFSNVIAKLFDQEKPNQILFSYLKNDRCIGYGGLVHMNWIDKNAEISFVMKTDLEKDNFAFNWVEFIKLLEQVAFYELKFHKIYTYAFDVRPLLYQALESLGFRKEAVLKEHCLFQGEFIDVVFHSKINLMDNLFLRAAKMSDAKLLFEWVNDMDVRTNSINQEVIIWENHLRWFERKIKDSDTKIFILTNGNNHFGQIRIEYEIDSWILDYSIDNKYRGNGLGFVIVKLLIEKFTNFKFKALVKKENLPSIHVLTKLGFTKVDGTKEHLEYFERKY